MRERERGGREREREREGEGELINNCNKCGKKSAL